MKIICKVLLHIREERSQYNHHNQANGCVHLLPFVGTYFLVCTCTKIISKFQIVFLPGLLRIRPSTVRWSISAFSLHRRCKGLHSNPRWK